MERKRTVVPVREVTAIEKAKGYASLNCKQHKACMDKAAKSDTEMNCLFCRHVDFIENNYRKEIGASFVTSNQSDTLTDELKIGNIR